MVDFYRPSGELCVCDLTTRFHIIKLPRTKCSFNFLYKSRHKSNSRVSSENKHFSSHASTHKSPQRNMDVTIQPLKTHFEFCFASNVQQRVPKLGNQIRLKLNFVLAALVQ